jgi:UDP-N-acetylmuramyl tripeptide synthase
LIRAALGSFANTPEHNPGRYNLIEGFPFQVLLDNGHNPDGVHELCEVVSRMPVKGQRHFLNQKLGNRHKAHFTEISPDLAKAFDYFVLSCDSELVKKCRDYAGEDPVNVMFSIQTQALLSQGVTTSRITQEGVKTEALRKAFAGAKPGDLLVLLADPWTALPWLDTQRRNLATSLLET